MRSFLVVGVLALSAVSGEAGSAGVATGIVEKVQLDELDLSPMTYELKPPRARLTVNETPLRVGGRVFARGVGTHAPSAVEVVVRGEALAFDATVGMDDAMASGGRSIEFRVVADGRLAASSGVVRFGDAARPLHAGLAGVTNALLEVVDDGGFSYAVWGDAAFTVMPAADARPKTHRGRQAARESAVFETRAPAVRARQFGILTPPERPEPRIVGASVFGVRPGHPILFTVAATGERPMRFAAEGLPPGVTLDPATGRLSGSVAVPGTNRIVLVAENAKGRATREFLLVAGEKLALTPPMGWNHWNCFGEKVTDARIRAAARALVSTGLDRHGWNCVNIDDCWQYREEFDHRGIPARDENCRIRSGGARFPDMRALTDFIHSLGLKAGLYSSPGPLTCCGNDGSWRHEHPDAARYAEWGFDYLKYDWCSYAKIDPKKTPEHARDVFAAMGRELRAQDRDIVYSLCNYGEYGTSRWGAETGAQCWRTTYDIRDTWGSVMTIADQQAGLEGYVAPGAWNDPDMLVVGRLGWGNPLRPTRLTTNEQYAHVSLWCVFAAPLLLGCDLEALDPFTLNLLTNDEVLEIDQDPRGAGATRVAHDAHHDVWVKPLVDGDYAVVLLNRDDGEDREVVFNFSDAGLKGAWAVRDLWRQQDLGERTGELRATLPGHAPLFVHLRRQADGGR